MDAVLPVLPGVVGASPARAVWPTAEEVITHEDEEEIERDDYWHEYGDDDPVLDVGDLVRIGVHVEVEGGA